MPLVNVEGVGLIDFPEGMSGEDIGKAIKNDILPKYPKLAAQTSRSWGEVGTDVLSSLATGVGGLAQVPGQLTQLTGLTTAEDSDKGLQGLGKQLEQFGQESKSTRLKGKEAVRAEKIAQADGMLAEFGTAIKETIRDPALLTSFFAEQLPNLAGSWGGGLLARGATKALMAEATGTALGKAGVRGAVGTGAVMQGADIGSETYEAVYKDLKRQGMDDEQANGIALSKGRVAGIEAAMLSLAATRLPGGTTIEKAMAGKGLPTAGGVARGLFGEAASEGFEEGAGKFASNVGVQEVSPETSLTRGVGGAAGMGALGGGLFGGVAGYTESRAKAMEDNRAEIEAAKNKAAETNETQTLALPYDPDVGAQPIMYVYPDGTMAFPSEANQFANENAQELSQEALEEKYAPQAIPEVITPDTLKEIGFSAKGGKPFQEVRASLIGKDIRDPAQAAEVKTILENYAEKTTSTKTIDGITSFLERPEFQPAPVEEVVAEPKKRGRKPKVVTEEVAPQQVLAEEVVAAKPKRRMKPLKPTAEEVLSAEEQAALQDELNAELEQNAQATTEGQVTGESATPIGGPSESSLRVPSERLGTTTGPEQSERRGMVPAGDTTGQPAGGAAPITGALNASPEEDIRPSGQAPAKPILLEPGAVKLSSVQAKNYKEAAANYLEKANYIGQRALETLAGDLYTGENLTQAKRFQKGLSDAQKEFVTSKLNELKKYETRGNAYKEAFNKKQKAEKAFKEELDQDQSPKVKMTNAIPSGVGSSVLTDAVSRGDLLAALTEIAKGTSAEFNILEKLVSNRLLANKGSLPKIEIVPAGAIADGVGQYNPFTDTVQIQEGYVNSHTVLHETVHGFLHSLIAKFEGEVGVKNKGISDLKALYEFVQERHPELADRYGMESLTEFASELMSNRDFQEELAQIPYRVENQSLFTAFIRSVLNALGLSPTQKLSALARGLIAADQSMALGRKIQEDVVTGKETIPLAKVKLNEELAANYKATGAERRAKPTVETGAFQSFKNSTKNTAAAKQGFSRFLNTAETMLFSADAALNNAIRKGLEAGGNSWNTIREMMYEVSTAQATHADALGMQFLQHGGLEYDPKAYKWKAVDKADSWSKLIQVKLSSIADKYGITLKEAENYAQQAFVANRLKGLSQAKRSVFSHMSQAEIDAGIKFFTMIPELKDLQDSWNAVRKNAMDVAIAGGLYSEAQAKELLDFMDYVPFYRVEQLAQNAGPKEYGRGLIDFAKGYKIEGSEDEVANIFDNMERWTSYTVSRAVKNRSALNLYNTAKQLFPDEVTDLRQDARVKREQNTIDLWENGIKKKVEFKDPLFIHAFTGIESAAIPHFGIASSVANFLRKNIVLMPLFSISQLSQDSFGAMLTSGLKHPWLLPLEVAKEFTKTLRGRSEAATELTKYGAVGVKDYSATFVRDTAEIMAGLKQETKMGKFGNALEKFAMASDNAVRQAIYNLTINETKSAQFPEGDKALAVERAFEIINFKRAGASGKIQMMRQVVPFFGAYLQAQNVVYKVVSGKGIAPQQRKEAFKVLTSNALKIGALAFMYAAIASDDEDYQKMDPQIRDRHLLIPGTSFMLPLRSDLTLMPKLIAEYTYLGMTDNAFTDGRKIRRAMSDALANAVMSPTAVPQAVKPILEVATNHNFFTGRSIVGQGIANKITSEQYTNSTSELAKLIGKTGLIAPVNVDHLIKGYMGTTGGLTLQATSAIMNAGEDKPKPEKSWQDAIASTPGLSAFVAREYGNADKNDFYELREEVDKINTTLNAMQKQGRKEEYKELFAENKDLMKVKTQVNNIGRQLTKLREYENHIYDLPEARMDAEKKGREIQRIREQEKKLLKNVHDLRVKAGY